MKLVKLNHNQDYVRFHKNITIHVNDLITVDVEICGGVQHIDSKLFGKVMTIEDPDSFLTFYVGGKRTKDKGFKELYNQLFKEDYDVLYKEICDFAESTVLSSYDNPLSELTKRQKIKLLREQMDKMPKFESDNGETIAYRQWATNEVLSSLNIEMPRAKLYNRLYEAGSTWGVDIRVYEEKLNELTKN